MKVTCFVTDLREVSPAGEVRMKRFYRESSVSNQARVAAVGTLDLKS